MPRKSLVCLCLGAALGASPVFSSDSGSAATGRSAVAEIEDLNVYTHFAYIPAGYDAASMRFEKVKPVVVHTQARYIWEPRYCHELLFRDPGGSRHCPYVEMLTPEIAYEITYSYKGIPLASDEHANRHFKFQVYFQKDELPSDLRQEISTREPKRAELSNYFQVSSSRDPVPRLVIDVANSTHCELRVDRSGWVKVDRNCLDIVAHKTVTAPSDYVTVRVDLR